MESVITVVVGTIISMLLAMFYVGIVAIGFWLFHMSLHTDIFTASAIVTYVLAPRVGGKDYE